RMVAVVTHRRPAHHRRPLRPVDYRPRHHGRGSGRAPRLPRGTVPPAVDVLGRYAPRVAPPPLWVTVRTPARAGGGHGAAMPPRVRRSCSHLLASAPRVPGYWR